jgi:hypothetical protein
MSAGVIRDSGFGLGLIELQQLHLVGVIDLALDLVGDRFADRTLHLELGGCTVEHRDAQADGELAVFIGGVFRFAPVGGKEFADVVDGLVLEGLVGVQGGVGGVV